MKQLTPSKSLTNLLLAEKLVSNLIDRDQDMNKGEVIVTIQSLLISRYGSTTPKLLFLNYMIKNLKYVVESDEKAFDEMVTWVAALLDHSEVQFVEEN